MSSIQVNSNSHKTKWILKNTLTASQYTNLLIYNQLSSSHVIFVTDFSSKQTFGEDWTENRVTIINNFNLMLEITEKMRKNYFKDAARQK